MTNSRPARLFVEEFTWKTKYQVGVFVDLLPISIVDFETMTIDYCHYAGVVYDKMANLVFEAMG